MAIFKTSLGACAKRSPERAQRVEGARAGAAHGGAATSVRAMEPRRQSLAMQRPHIIHIHIPRGTERGDDDGESDRGFGGGDGDDEEGEDLPDVLQPKPRESN